ncbi:hypothetical protein AX16_003815 [Volvariella volvacea WC 439]|nr:hypothetical protein AX16_003815 [Volvariella volvacea WC 439]
MSWFKRKDQPSIPPVEPAGSRGGSSTPSSGYRSNASTYVASRDGDLGTGYSSSSYNSSNTYQDEYADGSRSAHSRGGMNAGGGVGNVGDVYTRGQNQYGVAADLNGDRNELFSGYDAEKSAAQGGSGRFFDGPPRGEGGGYRPPPREGEETEDDVEGIKRDMRWVKQESVNSTRNALRLAREAEETGRNTLLRLGDQSEKLANTERHIDVAKGHNARAEDHANELKKLNRSIFRPAISFNKDSKRAAQEAKIQQRYEDEREEREKSMLDIRESQNRIGRAAGYGQGEDDGGFGAGPARGQRTAAQMEQRKRYQFEQTASDDELEDELDDNLNEISDVTKKLKALGMAMGQEIDTQNQRIDRIGEKVDKTDMALNSTTRKLLKHGK